MKIIFYASTKEREQELARAFVAGALKQGHCAEIRGFNDITEASDLVCMVGVKSVNLWRIMRSMGINTLMFDKGYSRKKSGLSWEYWRLSYNAHQPTSTTLPLFNYPSDRFDRLGFTISDWMPNSDSGKILFAGSSAKYHTFYDLPDPTTYAEKVVSTIRQYTDKEIVYRPKPSWKGAKRILGTTYSNKKEPLIPLFNKCCAVVTHGSNICFEAALHGLPTIILGDAVTKGISSTKLKNILTPRNKKRHQLFYNLAYHQWTLEEMRSGLMWETVGEWL